MKNLPVEIVEQAEDTIEMLEMILATLKGRLENGTLDDQDLDKLFSRVEKAHNKF